MCMIMYVSARSGGGNPEDSFKSGSATIISNSGNMTNTMASYLLSAGIGTAFGISTGKDVLILAPLKDLIELAEKNKATRLIILYIEPGGIYEQEALGLLKEHDFKKPLVVYVTGKVMEEAKGNLSLGHAGAVVEGRASSASAKMELFDEFFGVPALDADNPPELDKNCGGIRITSLHHVPLAAGLLYDARGWERDFEPTGELQLNAWFSNMGKLRDRIPEELIMSAGTIPDPYAAQVKEFATSRLGMIASRRKMRNASYASANDGKLPRIFGYPLTESMRRLSFAGSLILYWTGELPRHDFEARLVEMCLMAALTNGPGTISAQGAKQAASAGNAPNTAMIGTLASIGSVHGGNGAKATRFLLEIFRNLDLVDPYDPGHGIDLVRLVKSTVKNFMKVKTAAKEAGTDYEKVPCLGHPVFRNDDVNYDPREQVVYAYLQESKHYNIFLEFYHLLAREMKQQGATQRVMAVNVDAAIATVWLGITWPLLRENRITEQRAMDIPFLAFALGRAAGGGAEFLDHQDHGEMMDMRVPVSECESYTREREFED
ncbi:citrate/2-methylcitrate synthase [Planctomycetota bacterium]